MKTITSLAIAVTIAAIPLTAVAAYMTKGNPVISNLYGEDINTGEWRIVGVVTKPQTKLDNIYNDYLQYKQKKEFVKFQQNAINAIQPVILY